MNNIELLDQGGFGCVYHPGITCKGNKRKRTNLVTKLQMKSFNSKNEIKIGKMVKNIPDYERFFLPVASSCNIDLRIIKNQLASQCNVIKNDKNKYDKNKYDKNTYKNKPYVLTSIPYVENQSLFEYLTDLREKDAINVIVRTADYLLEGVSKLLDTGIVHFDLKGDNIIFDCKTEKPLIIDFGISIPIERPRFHKNVSKYFYIYAPEYYIWPLEVHIACFALHNSSNVDFPIGKSDAYMVAKDFVSNNKVIQELPEKKREKYMSECLEVAYTYVGLAASRLIEKVKSSYKTWDNYAVSILFLKLIRHILTDTHNSAKEPENSYSSLKLTSKTRMLSRLETMFMVNIEADPSKRKSLKDTRNQLLQILILLEGQPNGSVIDKNMVTAMHRDTISLNSFISRKK